MKTVIGCLNSKYIHASLSPWCLLAGVKTFAKQEHQIFVREGTINGDVKDYAATIEELSPQVAAFSCYIWNVEKTLEVCKILKNNLNCKIILGGPEVAYRAKKVLEKYEFVDFVLSGEGEYNFPLLLDELEIESEKLENVFGLTFRKNEEIICIPERVEITTPPSPFCDEFFENLRGRICYIETSRGCPYSCAFCLSGRCSPLRFFDIEQVKKDIISLANSGTKTVKFVDRTFNANYKRANEILEFILENIDKNIPKNVCFHFEIAGDILKSSTIEILDKFPKGTVQLEIGMQSFNEEVLKNINRKTNTKKLIENINKLVALNNMHIHIDLIAGLTGEDFESFCRSFNIGFSLNAHMLQLGFLKLLHGADMRENSDKYPCEFKDVPPYQVTKTPWLSAEEMGKISLCEDALERMYNSGRFIKTLELFGVGTNISAFDFFTYVGEKINEEKISLTNYAEKLYEVLGEKVDKKSQENFDKNSLRDAIVSDLIISGCHLQIPKVLKIKDTRLKKIKQKLSTKNSQNKFAILYSENKVLVCDYNSAPDLRGRFEAKYYPLDFFEDEK